MYLEQQQDADDSLTLYFSTCEEFLKAYIQFILRTAIQRITGEPLSESPDFVNFNKVTQVVFEDYYEFLFDYSVHSPPVQAVKERSEEMLERASLSSKNESIGPESRADWCVSHRTYDIGNRKEFERFKKFIKGTLGERYWWLWMDIERLKVLKDPGRLHRYFYFSMYICF